MPKVKPPRTLSCRRGNFTVRRFTPAEDRKLLAMEAAGLNHSAMGRKLGRRHNSIRGRLMVLARRDERLMQLGVSR